MSFTQTRDITIFVVKYASTQKILIPVALSTLVDVTPMYEDVVS